MKTKNIQLKANELQNSLAAKKKIKKPTLRNVLAQPLPRFWPEITTNETNELVSALKSGIESSETQSEESLSKKKLLSAATFGLNATLRKLQNRDESISILLISSYIKPKIILEQIVQLALFNNKNIKIIFVPDMDVVLKSIFKFNCLCMTLTQDQCLNGLFASAMPTIEAFSKKFPVPEPLVNLVNCKAHPQEVCVKDDVQMEPMKNKNLEQINFEELYLRKPVSNERAFIPGRKQKVSKQVESMDFISLNDNTNVAAGNDDNDDDDMTGDEVNSITGSTISSLQSTIGEAFKLIKSNNVVTKLQNLIIPKHSKDQTQKKKKKKKQNPKEMLKNELNGQKRQNYMPLKINRIQGNPNKIKKNKKKKQKSK